jgi:hypothetical protein
MEEILDIAVLAGNPGQKKLTIKEAISPRELEAFIGFPYLLYRGNPFYVPPLKSDETKTLQVHESSLRSL